MSCTTAMTVRKKSAPCCWSCRKRALGIESIRLDQHALQLELAEELPQHRPLVIFASGVARLADSHTQSSGVERELDYKPGTTTWDGFDRSPQRFAVANQLIEIACITGVLGDCPVANGYAEGGHIHLAEEVAEG